MFDQETFQQGDRVELWLVTARPWWQRLLAWLGVKRYQPQPPVARGYVVYVHQGRTFQLSDGANHIELKAPKGDLEEWDKPL